MTENFLVEKDGPITTITFNRPERRVLIVTGKGAFNHSATPHPEITFSRPPDPATA